MKVPLWVRLEAKPGKEADVDAFLLLAQPPVIERVDVLAAKRSK